MTDDDENWVVNKVLDRLVEALAAQVGDSATAALTPAAAAALAELTRAEANLIFGTAGHIVHYGTENKPLEGLIRMISEIQRDEAAVDAPILPGDEVRLVDEPETVFIVRYVGHDGTIDVQPELTVDYVMETVPAASCQATKTQNG